VADLELEPITSTTDLPVVVHGTYFKFWQSIRQQVTSFNFDRRLIKKKHTQKKKTVCFDGLFAQGRDSA
jgi:hypothetical protein